MKTVYIFSNGTALSYSEDSFIVTREGKIVIQFSVCDTGRVLIYGNTKIDAVAMNTLLDAGVPIYYVKRSGRLKGAVIPIELPGRIIIEHQYRQCSNSEFSIALAKSLVASKLKNMESMIFHLLRRKHGSAGERKFIQRLFQKLESCNSIQSIMGVEGIAAKHYFRIYGSQLPPPFNFKARSRRPAHDHGNALLNLGYMTLLREVQTHLEIHQIDPYYGVLHAVQDNRPSLALDVMEEFRQPFIDLFILKIVRLRQIQAQHFASDQSAGIKLTSEGLTKFFNLYRQNMGEQDGEPGGFRKILDQQVHSLKNHFLGKGNYRNFHLTPTDSMFPR